MSVELNEQIPLRAMHFTGEDINETTIGFLLVFVNAVLPPAGLITGIWMYHLISHDLLGK